MSCVVPRVHVDDIGTKLTLILVDQQGTVIDVSSASLLEIKVRQPDGNTFTRPANFAIIKHPGEPDGPGDGTDGAIEIVSEAGDFPFASPNYRMQGHVVVAALDVRTEVETFEVEANL